MVAGGVAGMLLADFGAEVVKVEQPAVGDPLRQWTTDGDALYAANATMMALYHRDHQHGMGQCIDLALFDSLFSLLGPLPAEYAAHGRVRSREGSRSRNSSPRGCFPTRDGRWVAVSGSTPAMAERFLRAYGLDQMLCDPKFATNEARVKHAAELDAAIGSAIADRTLEENMAIIDATALTAVAVQTIADIERDPHWRERQLTIDVPADGATVRMHNVVPRFSQTPGAIEWAGGALGRDNDAF